jgi:hypothetical protein
MHKNIKKYLIVFSIILPIGGFFVISQYFFGAKGPGQGNIIGDASANTLTALAPTADTATLPTPNQAALKTEDKTLTSNEVPVAVATTSACRYPSQILNLSNWKQTLPTGSKGKPTEIKEVTLASYSANPYFLPSATCDGVVFRAPVNGVTTSGSGYPRSELREMTNNGKSLASWSTTSGIHSMYIEQAITAVPKSKKHIVAGQIHDADDDVVVIRLEYPKLFVDINGKEGPTLDSNYTLGKRFSVKFVASNGNINIFYNDQAASAFSMKKASSGNYFKAGAYTQSNCSKEKDCSENNFGEVVIYKLATQQ